MCFHGKRKAKLVKSRGFPTMIRGGLAGERGTMCLVSTYSTLEPSSVLREGIPAPGLCGQDLLELRCSEPDLPSWTSFPGHPALALNAGTSSGSRGPSDSICLLLSLDFHTLFFLDCLFFRTHCFSLQDMVSLYALGEGSGPSEVRHRKC